jgi:DNA-binding CsgD family transcriptional regulator
MFMSKHPTANNDTDNGPVFDRPRISLLSEEHWLYLRKQYCMSPRELQVAKLVCQGFNNEEIASSLRIKEGTIKTHMRNIYRRIRVKSRIEMLLRFVDNVAKSSTKLETELPLSSNIKKPDMTTISPPSDVS